MMIKTFIFLSIFLFGHCEFNEMENYAEYWNLQGQMKIQELVDEKINSNVAKNVIMFVGDGMSLETVAATRMLLGGESKSLSFENFPYVGFAKTYCVNSQVGEGACTSTAYLSGIKTNRGIIGLTAEANEFDCKAQKRKNLWTESFASWTSKSCKSTGIVTTSRVTDASTAGAYAHAASRFWENDHEVSLSGCNSNDVDDIAEQLIYGEVGKKFKVILGGGRSNFFNKSHIDEEGKNGNRMDGKNLIDEWKIKKESSAKYIWNNDELSHIDLDKTDFLLGLFEDDEMKFNLDTTKEDNKPSLSDMTRVAIEMLEKDKNGYFLLITHGLIDKAHHNNFAQIALDETKEFSKAVEMARSMTSDEETLIVVIADHAHNFVYNGYPKRGDSIFGAHSKSDIDGLPYTTLSYGNGPGFNFLFNPDGSRVNPLTYNFSNHKLQYPSAVPMKKATHGGQDVGVWASGPQAHLFSGTYEQNAIPLIMAHVLEIGPYAKDEKCAAHQVLPKVLIMLLLVVLNYILKFN